MSAVSRTFHDARSATKPTPVDEIVRKYLRRYAPNAVSFAPELHLNNDLHIDFWDRLCLFADIEEKLDFAFTEDEMANYSTVGALIALVENRVAP
jgi:acyl carrier protein